jgi:hypothetical protein
LPDSSNRCVFGGNSVERGLKPYGMIVSFEMPRSRVKSLVKEWFQLLIGAHDKKLVGLFQTWRGTLGTDCAN